MDYEVLRHLDSIKQSRVQTDLKHMVKSGPKSENLETILIEVSFCMSQADYILTYSSYMRI